MSISMMLRPVTNLVIVFHNYMLMYRNLSECGVRNLTDCGTSVHRNCGSCANMNATD